MKFKRADGRVIRPSASQASLNDREVESEMRCGISKRILDAIDGQIHVGSCPAFGGVGVKIILLLFGCGPSAVAGFVIPVGVRETIKRVALWSRTHVGQEILEREPSFTDRHSSTAVISESVVIRVQASALHARPSFVFRGLAAGTVPMRRICFPAFAHPFVYLLFPRCRWIEACFSHVLIA
jgi:hypothetical protein